MSSIYIITAFIVLSMIISALFLYISNREKDEMLMLWGISWIFYSASLICLMLSIDGSYHQLLDVKKLLDMLSIQSLMFGLYKFCQTKIPGYWARFSIYLVVWVGISLYLKLDSFSVSLPVFIFDIVMTANICYIIIKYWQQSHAEKFMNCTMISLWCCIKIYIAICDIDWSHSYMIYLAELLYTGVLNVCIFLVYIRNIRQEMAMTKARLEIIVENAIDAIFYYTFRPRPKFLYVTPSIEAISGYSPKALYNDPRTILEMVSREDYDMINKIFFSGPYDLQPANEIFRLEKKDGVNIWAEMKLSVIKEGDNITAIEGIIRDITQMKEAQDGLQTSKKSRELMLSYISHELKTPITSIMGYATAIRDGTLSDSGELKRAMDIISNKSMLLERMIMDLFQLSQLETNQYSFIYEHMSCVELAEYVHDNVLPELKDSGISYRFVTEDDKLGELFIIADPARINQVITNLVTNAVKYTRKNNRIVVKSTFDEKKKNMVISVADSGMGIAEEDLPYIFDKFFKSENSEAAGSQGRGLGLAISKEIVEAHGGTIEVKSKYGKGSVFKVNIPIYRQ